MCYAEVKSLKEVLLRFVAIYIYIDTLLSSVFSRPLYIDIVKQV